MGKKVIRLTESDLVKIVKRVIEEQDQSFSDKLRQKMLFFKPLKMTDDRKLKLFEFVVNSIESGNYTTDAYRTTRQDVHLVIHSNDEIVIDGIKTKASIVVLNVRRKKVTGRIPSSDVIVQIPQNTKGYRDMGFMDDNDPLFQKFVGLCQDILKSDKKTGTELELAPIDFSRTSPPDKEEDEPIRRYRVYNDFNNDGYTDDNKFGGFGGGSFGGGGSGSDF
jgi:uncharacterized membrane protein YgcG